VASFYPGTNDEDDTSAIKVTVTLKVIVLATDEAAAKQVAVKALTQNETNNAIEVLSVTPQAPDDSPFE
jgi:hypothetical protein